MKVQLKIYRTASGSVIVTNLDLSDVAGYMIVNTAEVDIDAPEVDSEVVIAAEKARKLAYLRAELAKLEEGE